MKRTMLSVWLCVMALGARGEQEILVQKGGGKDKLSLDLSGVAQGAGQTGELLLKTIKQDLERSGWFTVYPRGGIIQVRGKVSGGIRMDCQVVQAGGARSYLNKAYSQEASEAVLMGHRIADDIVYAVKGVRGIASTRIAMIGASGKQRDLYYTYAGGGGMTQVTRDGIHCTSPAWSPGGDSLFYTSMKSGFNDIYRINLANRQRSRVCKYPGLNDGAAISPDGSRMAMTLSKDGNPELYIKELGSGTLQRLTRTPDQSEASPCWSPDGSRIVYVGGTTGRPQLYIIASSGGAPKRLTRVGSQNVSPSWGPDGRIAYASLLGGRFQICVVTPGGEPEVLTSDGYNHEEPVWAPDGRHIAYSKTSGRQSAVYILDTLGDPEIRLTPMSGNWYSPAWSDR